MRGRYGTQGQYVRIDPKHPSAMGMCDHSGMLFNHKDLHKQMEWRGDALVWTGLMVGTPFLDIPDQQKRPFRSKVEPKVVKNPRLPDIWNDPYANSALDYHETLALLKKVKFDE